MGTPEITLLSSGVWLIPLILLATLGGLFLLARHWRGKTEKNLKGLRHDLRQYYSGRRVLDRALQEHHTEDPEPYGSRVRGLLAELQNLDQQTEAIERENVRIHERIRRMKANPWQMIVGGPYFWFSVQAELNRLLQRFQSVTAGLTQAQAQEERLTRVGWEVATQARQVATVREKVEQALGDLSDKNIRGEPMEAALAQEAELKEALDTLQPYFFQGDEEAVLNQAEKTAIAHAHETLKAVLPGLEGLLARAAAWQKEYQAAEEKVALLRKVLSSAENTLGEMPEALSLAPLKNHFTQLKVISESLHATLSRMEVDSMAAVREEAGRVSESAHDLEKQMRDARRKYMALEALLPELSAGLREISTQVAALGGREIHPVVWDQSRAKLTYLSRQNSAIGSIQKPRTLDQVEQDFVNATKLNEQRLELAGRVQKVTQQHAELLALMTSPELTQAGEWLKTARKTVEQIQEYDPENWPRLDNVPALPTDLQSLGQRADSLLVTHAKDQISEGKVADKLEEARNLALEIQNTRTRVQNVQARLKEIQESEQQAQENLDRVVTTLNGISLLASSNPFLGEMASGELTRLQNNVKSLGSELEQPERGSLERKARGIAALITRLEQGGNKWMDLLGKELEVQKKSLSNQLTEMEGIAALDEPAVQAARRLLSEGQALGVGAVGKSRLTLDNLVLELRRRSEHWQSCSAAERALQDVSEPLVQAYKTALQERDQARQQVSDLTVTLRAARAWPPTSISAHTIRQDLERVEKQWEGIKTQPTKALSLVSQFSNLATGFRSVRDKAGQMMERITHEQATVTALEEELEELGQAWQNQWTQHRENPMAAEEIRHLLDELNAERNNLHQQYKQGQKDYNQVLERLQGLRRKVRMAQVSIDDTHVIDVNGQVIAYR